MHFYYVKIPVGAGLAGREPVLHEQIETALTSQGVGTVLGWGDSLGEHRENKHAAPAFHRIDIEVLDPQTARPVLQAVLTALDVPTGTELHYTVDGVALQDVYGPGGWSAPQPSSGATLPRRH